MDYMSKKDIGVHLNNYAKMMVYIRQYPKNKIIDIYTSLIDDDINSFFAMLKTSILYNNLKLYSYVEDFVIDRLFDSELNFDDIKEELFVNRDDARYFSKKQIVTYIRNAFNHSDGEKELYKISASGDEVEIDLKNTKPKPFNIVFNNLQLQRIFECVCDCNGKHLLSNFNIDNVDIRNITDMNELSKIKFNRYYFDKKIPNDLKKEIQDSNLDEYDTDRNVNNKLRYIFNKYSFTDYHKEVYDLKDEQKRKIKELFLKVNLNDYDDELLNGVLIRILHECIPLGMFKCGQVAFERNLMIYFMSDYWLTYDEINEKLEKIICGKNNYEKYDECDMQRYEQIRKYYGLKEGCINVDNILFKEDNNSRMLFPMMNYFGYLMSILDFSTYNTLNFGGKLVDAEHVRNSLTHGRWFIGPNNNIELYDCKNGKNNDYNFDFYQEIDANDFIYEMKNVSKLVNESILKNKLVP